MPDVVTAPLSAMRCYKADLWVLWTLTEWYSFKGPSKSEESKSKSWLSQSNWAPGLVFISADTSSDLIQDPWVLPGSLQTSQAPSQHTGLVSGVIWEDGNPFGNTDQVQISW